MQLKKKEAERIFLKLNVKPRKSKHHVSGWLMFNEKKILPVHYSNGKGDMPGRVGDRFRQSLKLTIDEFQKLKSCSMSCEEFFSLFMTRVET